MTIREILTKLITFKTVTGNTEACREAFDWIEQSVRELPLFKKRMTFDGFESLVLTTQDTKTPRVWLAAHIDVVPAPDEMFTPTEEGSRLRARGAADMKFAVACYLQLLHDIKENLSDYDIGIMLTSDEEIGGFNGTKKVLEAGYGGGVAFLPDGGVNGEIVNRARGVHHIRVVSRGTAAHGSRPWLGENAVNKLMRFLEELQAYFDAHCKPEDTEHFHRSMNIGIIRGGTKINSVPDKAEADVDIRFASQDDLKDIKRIIADTASRHEGIEVEPLLSIAELNVSLENPFLKTYMEVFEREYGFSMKPGIDHGASDASFFSEHDIPVVMAKPVGGDQHSEQEWVDMSDVEGKYYNTLKTFVLNIARVP